MKIGIIGAGKVGCTLGKYLVERGKSVTGYFSKTMEHAAEAADITETKVFEELDQIVSASDTLFVTTPDGEISKVWDCIAKCDVRDKIICHFSGSLSSSVFSGIERLGASGCSFHPMYAFSDKFTSYEQFHTAFLVGEGQEPGVSMIRDLFASLGHRVLFIKGEDKMKYHGAAALVSNNMIALYQAGLSALEECGFSPEDSRDLIAPLVRNNVESMLEKGPVQALTGPMERGDLETIQKHLEAFEGTKALGVYQEAGKILADIAIAKHPDRKDVIDEIRKELGN